MKTYTGSLQKRGNCFYLVMYLNGTQKWVTLKTGKLRLARMRAAKIAPRDPDNEIAWLEQLVREGEQARQRLAKERARRELTWENLVDWCGNTVDAHASWENRTCHERWIGLLAVAGRAMSPQLSPCMIDKSTAKILVEALAQKYISLPRMVGYFRSVWDALGLDGGIWPRRSEARTMCQGKTSERYRRLAVEEVEKVYEYLRTKDKELAEMVIIGYFTGLRLSDVAELELSEVCLPFLRVCPNKTRQHKPIPLKIPLISEVAELISALQARAKSRGTRYLFSAEARHRPSRKISRAFRACGIYKLDGGRASFHSLRATFVSLMDDAGVPPHLTDSITGHGGGGMHARYTQPSDEALMAAVKRAIPCFLPATAPGQCSCRL